MQFLKKTLGFGGKSELQKAIEPFQARGVLYNINGDDRSSTVFSDCLIKLEYFNKVYVVGCHSNQNSQQRDYYLPVHTSMNLIVYMLKSAQGDYACFEWTLDEENPTRLGCYFEAAHKQQFKKLVGLILNEKSSKKKEVPEDWCQELAEMPTTKKPVPKVREASSEESLNEALMNQSRKESVKMANTGRLYYIKEETRTEINPAVVFTIEDKGGFTSAMFVYDMNGYKILEREITPSLSYEANLEECYLKWLDLGQECKIVEIRYDKLDAIFNVRMGIQECLFEMHSKKKLKDAIEEEDNDYVKRMMQPIKYDTKVVEKYNDTASIHILPEAPRRVSEKEENEDKTVVESVLKNKEWAKYEDRRVLCQAKIAECSLVSLADNLEMLVIDDDSRIRRVEALELRGPNKETIIPNHIMMYDTDSKAMISAEDNSLYSLDVNEMRIVEKFTPCKEDGLRDIVPERKLAELGQYNTFLGVNEKAIYQIDPRISKTGVAQVKAYATNPAFNQITTTSEGCYAIGSEDGAIRLYQNEVGKNANNRYPGLGDPVRHLENTKDGRWLLATYDHYLILLPTFNEEDVNLYQKKTAIAKRPVPRKLQIKMQHLRLCRVGENWRLLPAHFDESKQKQEKFIVSGFDQFVVVWSLSKLMKGDTSYTFAKTNDPLTNAEFKFNDPNRLIMTTPHKVKLQQNQISSNK